MELITSGSLCLYMVAFFFASLAGVYGALKARGDGAPDPGPSVMALGFGITAFLTLWVSVFEGTPNSVWAWSTFRTTLASLSAPLDVIATGLVLVGLALLRPANRGKDDPLQ